MAASRMYAGVTSSGSPNQKARIPGSPRPSLATSRICEATSARTLLRADRSCTGRRVLIRGSALEAAPLYCAVRHGARAMKVYGIVNCNTVKAARAWLDANKKRYEFVDFKKTPPTREQLVNWCAVFGWENVLNRRGTTWRMLSPAEQAKVTGESPAI